ncbi:MAG: hypothetical protein JOZ87_37835 [Chloroflexi bacterium]|nr:hypothetical protein [Chloroflexota bacterium]
MPTFDITQTNRAIDQLLETTTKPLHRYLLQAYHRHRNLEMAGRYREIFVPEMTVEHPVYHFHMMGQDLKLDGAEAVMGVYQQWAMSGQSIFYAEDEEIAVSDHMVCSMGFAYQQVPGAVLAAAGLTADQRATYLYRTFEEMTWPYDDRGRLVGEHVWEPEPTQAQLIKLEPEDVLTTAEAGRQLAPFIKPLPSFESAVLSLSR